MTQKELGHEFGTDQPTPTGPHGLVLEGGGMRGMFTAGVLDAMMEEGITFDGIIGVSAGALFGVNFKSHQPGRTLRYNIRYKDDPRYMSLRSWWKTGDLVGDRFAYDTLPFHLDPIDREAFRDDPTAFWLVATDIDRGEPVYHHLKKIDRDEMRWLRASASMPVVSRPVIDAETDLLMLDGGLSDSIPLKAFERMGYTRCVVVLTQPALYYKRPTPLLNQIIRLAHRHHTHVYRLMKERYRMYNRQLDYVREAAAEGRILLIQPPQPLRIGRTELDEKKMRRIHRLGHETAMSLMDQIRDYARQPLIVDSGGSPETGV